MANKSIERYHKAHMKLYSFRFNKRTQSDIIEHLESQENKAGYIARLIREDLIKQGKKPFEVLTLSKLAKDIGDNDDVVLFFPDDSKMLTSKERLLKDNRVVDHVVIEEHINNKTFIAYVRW